MALVVKDRVQETSTTTGTGSLTLLGAVTGFQTFSSAIGNTNTTYYTIQGGAEWEVGIGTVSAGALSRDTVLESSNSGSLVDFSAGSKFVFCTYPAERSVNTEDIGVSIQAYDADTTKNDVANTFTANQVISVTDNTNAALRVTQLGTGNALVVEDATNPDSTPFVIDANGNVGIGTNNPAAKLDVEQTSTTAYALISQTPTVGLTTGDYVNMAYFTNGRSTNNDGLRIVNLRDSTGSSVGDWGTESYRIRRSVDQNNGSSGVQEEIVFGSNILGFNTFGSERMRIDSAGNVGIGTSSPAYRLDISPNSGQNIVRINGGASNAADGGAIFIRTGADTNIAYGNLSAITGGAYNSINAVWGATGTAFFTGGNNERMRIDASGNVGIGTSSPGEKLQIAGNIFQTGGGFLYQTNGTNTVYWSLNPFSIANSFGVGTAQSIPFIVGNNNTERMRIDASGNLLFNSGYGSVATAYGCRAWVNFNGTGTVAIRDSGNVSSITDNGTGLYTVNFTNAMPDINYSIGVGIGGSNSTALATINTDGTNAVAPTTSAFRIKAYTRGSATGQDAAYVNAAIFR